MKIGIFGDSFASRDKSNPTDSWIDVLEKEFEVEVHSKSSSNLFFSVTKFKEHYQKYDKNIFIVTSPGRIKLSDRVPVNNDQQRYVATVASLDWRIHLAKSHENSSNLLRAYQAVKDYYSYIQDDEFDYYIHSLMLNDIKKISNNIIMIPAFKNSYPEKNINMSLYDIYIKENKKFNFSQFSTNLKDTRNCHMTYENNLILGNKIMNCLKTETNLELSIDDFEFPDNADFYIKKYE
jgi:hypothetical protein